MSNKIMNLMELAMQVNGEKYASVDFNGSTKGVTIFISDSTTKKVLKRMVCYLDYDNAEEILNFMESVLKATLKNKTA